MLVAAAIVRKPAGGTKRRIGGPPLGGWTAGSEPGSTGRNCALELAGKIHPVRSGVERIRRLRNDRSRLPADRGCRHQLGERSLYLRRRGLGAHSAARQRDNCRRRHLRRLFPAEVRAGETAFRGRDGSPKVVGAGFENGAGSQSGRVPCHLAGLGWVGTRAAASVFSLWSLTSDRG